MRFSQRQLERKRGKRRAIAAKNDKASANLALFCGNDDYLMIPCLTPEDPTGRVSKRSVVYVCPNCGNTINPLVQEATHGMTVQTPDNAIQYQGKGRTIAKVPNRSSQYLHNKPDDDLAKFINDKLPNMDNMYVNVTKRTIERKGTKHFKLAKPN